MALPRPTYDVDVIQQLSNLPNSIDGLSGPQLKAKFDEIDANQLAYQDTLIDALELATPGSEGALSIGAYYNAAETNVQAALVSVKVDIGAVQTGSDGVQANVDILDAKVDALEATDIGYVNTVPAIPGTVDTVQKAIEAIATLTGVDVIQELIDASFGPVDAYNKRIAWGGAPY